MLLITKDFKADWWDLDAKKRPRGPRSELVQELRDLAQADLLLLALDNFVIGARTHLSSSVSDRTVKELRAISDDADALLPDVFTDPSLTPNLLDLDLREFERLIHYLLIRMGHDVDVVDSVVDCGYDFLLSDHHPTGERRTIVRLGRITRPVRVDSVLQLRGALGTAEARHAIFFSTSSFTSAAQKAAEDAPMQLIDGAALLQLLAAHGIRATIGFDGP